ncbi:MAG: thiamine diphosphokinase [Christensenella sp.]
MDALMVASGEAPSEELFKRRAKDAELLIAVDNGLSVFEKFQIVPHLIVGDMDSVSKKTLKLYEDKSEIITAPTEKNETDAALAVDEAAKRGVEHIVFLGATGGRIDHLLSNLMLLKYAHNKDADLIIEDDEHEICLRRGNFDIYGKKGQTVSIIPMNKSAVVNAKGLYYPLVNLVLTNEHPRGVSNVFLGNKAAVKSDDFVFIIKVKK